MNTPARRRGFTLIELFLVIVIVGLLSGIGLLRYVDLRRTAFTSQVAGDIAAVRLGAITYFGDTGEWPATIAPGSNADALTRYVPAEVFDRELWQVGWVNIPTQPHTTLGVMVTSSDAQMVEKLRQRFEGRYPFVDLGNGIMYLLSTPEQGI